MQTFRRSASRGFISLLVLLLTGIAPAPVFADNAQPAVTQNSAADASQSAPVASPANGTNGPTGSASGTYQYNGGTGLWENDYYTYDPSTHVTSPKSALEYTYNPSSGQWDTQVWQYNAAHGEYQLNTISVATPPSGAITHGSPVTPSQTTVSSTAPDGSSSVQTTTPTSSSSEQKTPDGATNTTQTSQNNTSNLTFSNAGTITNFGTANATSGNVALTSNTTAGNLSSGNATDVANYLNLLQSQSSLGGANVATFTKTIQGNVSGDLIIDPASLMQPANLPNPNLTNLNVNTANDGSIVNNVNLNANSGSAAATQNTSVGNVSTGSANAIADVVNMINSVVAANQSFMGVINIEGNYTGNILVPTDSLNALLGSSASDPGANNGQPVVSDIRNTSDQNIANNVDLAAASGNVAAAQNTKTGNVASGNGLTNLTLLNLTGRNVVAANSLLVFVNVLGSWVGLIMDAPAGTTSAALGGGVTSDTTVPSLTSNITNSDKNSITNNITANARSGDASATKNTTVGDVTSGNATASANIANLIGSNFSLSNWFGVLFINVLGTWHGNFGTVKPPIVPAITSGASDVSGGGTAAQPRVFEFVSRGPSGHGTSGASGTSGSSGTDLTLSPLSKANQETVRSADMVKAVSKVLGANTAKAATGSTTSVSSQNVANKTWTAVAISLGVLGFAYVGIDRVRTNLRGRRSAQK
jgi:hypothetical protein